MPVKITKVAATPEGFAAGDWEGWKAGTDLNDPTKSLPVDYEVRGTLLEDVRVGEPVQVARTERNGVPMPGFFITSNVVKTTKNRFITQNSVYLVELL